MAWLKEAIVGKKAALGRLIERPLGALAERCAAVWPQADALDEALREGLSDLPHCRLIYTLDRTGVQRSASVSLAGIEPEARGLDLAKQPGLSGSLPYRGLLLSAAYLNPRSLKPGITAVQAVRRGEELLGFIAAEFHVQDLPLADAPRPGVATWQQFKGDPAIRGTLFAQQRVPSAMDRHIDEVIALVHALITHHGVFHGKLHFSSSRATLWLIDDPFSYRLHGMEEILNPELSLAYPRRPYPQDAKVSRETVLLVLSYFKALRNADENIYLRSGSINVLNGLVGLTFSCDGSHYMPAEEFVNKDLAFWLGDGAQAVAGTDGA